VGPGYIVIPFIFLFGGDKVELFIIRSKATYLSVFLAAYCFHMQCFSFVFNSGQLGMYGRGEFRMNGVYNVSLL
jgi:hypothetical protein